MHLHFLNYFSFLVPKESWVLLPLGGPLSCHEALREFERAPDTKLKKQAETNRAIQIMTGLSSKLSTPMPFEDTRKSAVQSKPILSDFLITHLFQGYPPDSALSLEALAALTTRRLA